MPNPGWIIDSYAEINGRLDAQVQKLVDGKTITKDGLELRNGSLQVTGLATGADEELLTNGDSYEQYLTERLQQIDVYSLGSNTYQFKDDYGGQSGFTSVQVLSESHIAIHTWPEANAVEIDVYLCNYLRDNRVRCAQIYDEIAEYFKPQKKHVSLIFRPGFPLDSDTNIVVSKEDTNATS